MQKLNNLKSLAIKLDDNLNIHSSNQINKNQRKLITMEQWVQGQGWRRKIPKDFKFT